VTAVTAVTATAAPNAGPDPMLSPSFQTQAAAFYKTSNTYVDLLSISFLALYLPGPPSPALPPHHLPTPQGVSSRRPSCPPMASATASSGAAS
jgi:hypothetical protein